VTINKNACTLAHRYTDGVTGKKIAVLGPYPPPLGGVAIHVKRVIAKLNRQQNKVKCFDTTAKHRWRFWLYLIKVSIFLFVFRPDIIYYNTIYLTNSLPELRLIFFLKLVFGYEITCIEHNCRHLYTRTVHFKQLLSTILQKSTLILIGNSSYKSYVESGITLPSSSSVESAFLPPDETQESAILATYPKALFAFMKSSNPLLVANAFQLSLLDGNDLYGFDLCLELLSKLMATYPRVGLVFALAQIGNQDYFKKLCAMAERLQVQKNVYILHDQKELWPLLKRADLFVRPTFIHLLNVCSLQNGIIIKKVNNRR